METSERHAVTVGVLTILGTVFAMALTDAVVKSASAHMTLWQIYVLRSIVAVPVLAILARAALLPRPFVWVVLRSLALVLMYLAIYAAIPVLDLSVIAATLYTGPLFIVLLSAIFLREPIALRHWSGILLGFAGVMFVVRPAAADFAVEALIPVLAALLYAVAAVLTRAKCAGIPPITMGLWLNVGLLIFGALSSLAVPTLDFPTAREYPFLFGSWSVMQTRDWAIIGVLAALIVAVSIGLARAYQSPKPQVIACFDYAYLIFAAFWGYLFFGETPDAATAAGMIMIAVSGCLALPGKPDHPGRKR